MQTQNRTQNHRLLRLLQLASPVLPVGAYSYSEGIEALVQQDTIGIANAAHLEQWLMEELQYGAVRLEAAIMVRAYRAVVAQDLIALEAWNDWLSAARETEELRSQSLQMGRSLLRLFQTLSPETSLPSQCHFAIAFGLVAATWQIDVEWATLGYLHSWATNLVSAGIKLIPLGQTAGQQLLFNLEPSIECAAQNILTLQDNDLSSCGWGLTLASMAHETLYSRLFRS